MRSTTFLTEHEAAEFLGLSPRTLCKWRHRHRGPRFVRLSPGAVRYSAEDLEFFIDGATVTPGDAK